MKMTWKLICNVSLVFVLVFSLFTPVFQAETVAATNAITVSEAIANNTGNATVEGYIIAHTKGTNSYSPTPPFDDDNNLALADSPNETDVEKMMPVQIPTKFRSEFGLKSNPTNIGKKVRVTGNLKEYFSVPGLKEPTAMEFVEDSPPTQAAPVQASVTAGGVKAGTEITLSTDTPDATIYYTIDDSEPTTSSLKYSGPITIDKDLTIKAIAVADGLDQSNVSTFQYYIVEVQNIKEVRASQIGSDVSTIGVVTAIFKNTVHIQDETGAIALHPASSLPVELGDQVEVTGKLGEYNGLLQIQNTVLSKKVGNVEVPNPTVLTGDQLNEEQESILATVNKVQLMAVESGNGWANFKATDGNKEFIVRDERNVLNLSAEKTYDSITGIVQEFNGTYQIVPRNLADIVEDNSTVQPVIATPDGGVVASGTKVSLSSTTTDANIFYTTDGTNPSSSQTKQPYSEPITINKDMTIKTYAEKEGLNPSVVKEYGYTVFDPEQGIQIHHIQGEAHQSTKKGEQVSGIEGIVTYKYNIGSKQYFHMQAPDNKADNDPKTSEAIVVDTGNSAAKVAIGDLVTVEGKVDEYQIDGYNTSKTQTDLPVTKINATAQTIKVLSSNQPLPAPIEVDDRIPTGRIDSDGLTVFNPDGDAIDFWESLEGMRVVVKGPTRAVAPQEHGDLIVVNDNVTSDTKNGGVRISETDQNPERIQFKLYPNNEARDFNVKTGDTFAGEITGVVNYGFQNYKIYTDLAEMKDKHTVGSVQPEQTTIEFKEDQLTIASYNLENFSNNSAANETPNEKVGKLARAIANDMKNPDIIGLTEVQDNNGKKDDGTTDASESYQRLIEAIKKISGVEYKYANVDPINNEDGGAPGANIRVGFLYNPKRVSLTGGEKPGKADEAVAYKDGKLTLNPGRIEPTNKAFDSSRKPLAAQFTFKGEEVVVVANHFNSKNGDTPLFGSQQPPVYGSETQRHQIAAIVNDFVKTVKQDNPEANVVVLGDLNDFEYSKTLEVLKGQELTNMIDKADEKERYTYSFQGNSQVLDHILVSNNMANSTAVDIVHVNADFTDMAGRASDHDPVLIQTSLAGEGTPPVMEPSNIYTLKNFTTKKLIIETPYTLVDVNSTASIKEAIVLKATSILKGEGLDKIKVIVSPTNAGTIIDFSGAKVKEVVIDNSDVKEIRGAENVQQWILSEGVDPSTIKFFNSKGEAIASPFDSKVNKGPIVSKALGNVKGEVGQSISIDLNEYFSDPDGDELTFTTSIGTIKDSMLTLPTDQEGNYIVTVKASDHSLHISASFSLIVSANQPLESYYQAAAGKNGQELKSSLHNIIKGHTQLSYDQVWDALKETDQDPNNANNVILLYSGKSTSKNNNGGGSGQWNREHVWAKSHGNFGTSKGPGTDIHHLRPEDVNVNSKRGHLDFDNGGSQYSGCDCSYDQDSWEPPDRVKGDVARMLFYMDVRYEGDGEIDLELSDSVNTYPKPLHGKKSTLLAWHKLDPVDDFERNRNDIIYEKWQHNRNPFIDHPEWAESIWGNSNMLDVAS
ncbi:endonuclease [Bacillus sp. JJ722]|uniref:endonuclease n=1 Tax=Bacillus sp. JJ722 TaxID=3122973 RepID=UPI002FFDEA6C